MEDCPGEEDLSVLTNSDSLSAMRLLRSMQRGDFPLPLHLHPVRQLLVHVVKLINRLAETGCTTRFIEVRVHRGGPLNKLAYTLASEASELDPDLAAGLG